MRGLTVGQEPLYQRHTIVKVASNCPIFVKTAPISSAPVFGARWMTNLSRTFLGVAQLLYAFIANVFWTDTATGKTKHIRFVVCFLKFSLIDFEIFLATFQAEMELEKLRPARVNTHLCSKEFVVYQLRALQHTVLNFPCSE